MSQERTTKLDKKITLVDMDLFFGGLSYSGGEKKLINVIHVLIFIFLSLFRLVSHKYISFLLTING